MEESEEKETEEDVESETEAETEEEKEEAKEKEIEADLGDLLGELAKNDIQVELVWDPEESQATAAMKRQEEDGNEVEGEDGSPNYRVLAGAIAALSILLAVLAILQVYPQVGMTIMISAIGGIFASIANEILSISRSIEKLDPNRND